MPDISNIRTKAIARYLLCQLIGAGNNIDHQIENYRRIFVRLVDKAIYEYNEARCAIIAQIKDKGKGSIYIAAIINHLENCINAIRRALQVLSRIKKHPRSPIFFERSTLKHINSYSGEVKGVRNAIEHIDKYISRDEIKKGQSVALNISEDASETMIGDKSMRLTDLADLLQELHKLSLELAEYNAPGTKNQHFKIIKKKRRGDKIKEAVRKRSK